MPLSEVEHLLFSGISGASRIDHFRVQDDRALVYLTDVLNPKMRCGAQFDHISMISLNVLTRNPDVMKRPWDLIGFGCQHIADERWRFVVRCAQIEFVFESEWPSTWSLLNRDEEFHLLTSRA